MTKARSGFRLFFYFRTGYAIYFAMIVGIINILTSTYYLSIEQIPVLLNIFPTFESYLLLVASIGIPLVGIVGWIHLKKVGTYAAEQNVSVEANPYNFKLLPGYYKEVLGPVFLEITRLYIKKLQNQPITEQDIQTIKNLEEKLKILIDGGYVGNPPKGVF